MTWPAGCPTAPVDAHKGNFGHLLVVAGREGRAGAAVLAARAAVTLGAGLVTVATARGAVRPVQAQVPEAMVDPLPAGKDGAVSGEGLEGSLGKATALAVGPGLGITEGPRRLLARILDRWSGPLVLDADALTLLAGRLEELRRRTGPTVLTPHPGELGRLLGVPTSDVTRNRLQAAQEAAKRSGAVVLAKGARTVIAGGAGWSLVNPTGTPGLASGGAGDVLTGAIGALLAQGLPRPGGGSRRRLAARPWRGARGRAFPGRGSRREPRRGAVAGRAGGAPARMTEEPLSFEAALPDVVATEALGARIAALVRPGDLLLLEGPLGAGKTTLVRGLVAALGGDPGEVCSPTFVLLESYAVRAAGLARVHHADLYRLRGRPTAPWDEVGLGDALEDPAAVTAVEWPEPWEWLGGQDSRVLRVRLDYRDNARTASVRWEATD